MSNKPLKIAVVGSRTFDRYYILERVLNATFEMGDVLVSGGAAGADDLAHRWALENDHKFVIFYADWKSYGRSAGFIRNQKIVNYADQIIAFHDGVSKGTLHTVKLGVESDKLVQVYDFEGNLKKIHV